MSVATALNMTRETVLEVVVQRWPEWSQHLPALRLIDRPDDLEGWLRNADPGAADEVLRALAHLAAADGLNDLDAATVLVWVMLPGACRVAAGFARTPDIDEHVAAQLWIEVRSFSWQTTSRVAANITGRLRKHLRADLSEPALVSLTPTVAPATTGTGIVVALAHQYGLDAVAGPGEEATAMEELLSVLEWGCLCGVITSQDRLLLLDVIAAAADQRTWLSSGASLLGDKVSDAVGTHWGISGRTVRRRAAASINALAEIAAHQRIGIA